MGMDREENSTSSLVRRGNCWNEKRPRCNIALNRHQASNRRFKAQQSDTARAFANSPNHHLTTFSLWDRNIECATSLYKIACIARGRLPTPELTMRGTVTMRSSDLRACDRIKIRGHRATAYRLYGRLFWRGTERDLVRVFLYERGLRHSAIVRGQSTGRVTDAGPV